MQSVRGELVRSCKNQTFTLVVLGIFASTRSSSSRTNLLPGSRTAANSRSNPIYYTSVSVGKEN
jgi:hypothetical protein